MSNFTQPIIKPTEHKFSMSAFIIFSISTFYIYKITELIHKTSKKDAISIKHLMFYKTTKKYAYGHVVNQVLSFFKLRNSHLKITPQQAISMNK